METIVYSNLIDLLLEYGNKTEEEIVKDAIERFGFPIQKLKQNIASLLASKESEGYIEKYKDDGKYHLLDMDLDSEKGRMPFMRLLSETTAEDFNEKPYLMALDIPGLTDLRA